MDVETGADRFVGIDVSKARVDVHVRPDGTEPCRARSMAGGKPGAPRP